MDPAAITPQPPEPPRDLISSERVRFLTSWKLWLPMLFVAMLLIAASIVWPTYRRMRAIELIAARGGECYFGDTRWPWLADRVGRLGIGFREVEEIYLPEPVALNEFESLLALDEITTLRLQVPRVKTGWIRALSQFDQLDALYIDGEITTDGMEQLLEGLPNLDYFYLGSVTGGDRLSGSELRHGDQELIGLSIDECPPQFTVDGFPTLESVDISQMEDTELIVRSLPALQEVYLCYVNEGTVLTHDAPLEFLRYGELNVEEFVVPPRIRRMQIGYGPQFGSQSRCTITGGEDLTSLDVIDTARVTIQNLPALTRLRYESSYGSTMTLQNLPQLEHLILKNFPSDSPMVIFRGVDNLRGIDAPEWHPDDQLVAAMCRLPKLEHLVIPKAYVSANVLPLLQDLETLRYLRIPRRLYRDSTLAELRSGFPQPGIQIDGPFADGEAVDYWSAEP